MLKSLINLNRLKIGGDFFSKKLLLLSLIFILAATLSAQKAKFIGSWLMIKAQIGKEVKEPYFLTNFKKSGEMESMGMKLGTWKYNNGDIIMNSKYDKDFNGKSKILKLTSQELILEKDGNKFFYTKIDEKKMTEQNKKSGLQGLWKVVNEPDITTFIKFSLPDTFLFIKAENGVTDRIRGEWIFDSKGNNLIIMSFSQDFKGKNKVQKLSENELILKKNGKITKTIKKTPNKIERLTFEYEDFDEENSDEEKLPWRDFGEMTDFLKNIKHLKYRKGTLINEVNDFKYNTIISKIEVKPEKPSVMFSNLSVSKNDTMQFSQNYKGGLMDQYNDFFPKKELGQYKVIAIEDVTVPAGTFKCTVIEGMDGDTKLKYWMINDKPGIYAKIITEDISPFDKLEYTVTELEEIK